MTSNHMLNINPQHHQKNKKREKKPLAVKNSHNQMQKLPNRI